ncbi:hypothetical protein [Couchioplanes caeruleus]|uniref:IrrE N-terminal-like domain-containing protein n=2 Tax=Couchioplanes caeruleus TaxID=56438 RepID=A0A1K0G542_9ACTN|nr:hypothetical protein [Couchioplanes caeruleus]OJF12402.1 hypothetical protein BG844_20785 [Couchioplanes caeruleus subsp. caeruleus]ROP29493.1 hypothetical protein EDD30_2288 [Couchioplanes caeruleus]
MVLPPRRLKAFWEFRTLRQRCRRRLTALELPAAPSMAALCEQLGQRRNRPIYLMAMPAQDAQPCGVWLSLTDADVIAYEAGTNSLHQDHIIAHELAHLICGHSMLDDSGPLDTRRLFPDLDPALVRALLQRGHYSDGQEQEAEIMASLLLSRARRSMVLPGGTELTTRLAQALLPPQRRGHRTDA